MGTRSERTGRPEGREELLRTPLGPPPPPTSEAVSRSMRGNRKRDTTPELTLRRLLRQNGMAGYRIGWSKAPGRPDIAYPGRKLAVFVNGCFWHRCPTCNPSLPKSNSDFWRHKFIKNEERDARKEQQLKDAGWTVVVVWECEVRETPSTVVERLRQALASTDAASARAITL